MNITNKNGLKISSTLFDFINTEVIPGTNIDSDSFWNRFSKVVHELAPINRNLIQKREDIQKKINDWHKSNKGKEFSKKEYLSFLKSISYLLDDQHDFKIETNNVDQEISSIAGPQLVVPVDNARYALNAANARWGSLYDALYGTDVIPCKKFKEFNKERANKVIEYVRKFLDENFPLSRISWKEITKIQIEGTKLVFFKNSEKYFLNSNDQFIGFNGEKKRT